MSSGKWRPFCVGLNSFFVTSSSTTGAVTVSIWKCCPYSIEIPIIKIWRHVCTRKDELTHWGWVTHICVGKLIIIGSDNGLSPDWRQAIIWTNAGLLSFGSLQTYFNENLIKIQQFALMKMRVKMLSAKWHPSCPGLNVLMGLWFHAGICDSDPCQNGGSCQPRSDRVGYDCDCINDFVGTNCENSKLQNPMLMLPPLSTYVVQSASVNMPIQESFYVCA